MCLPPEPPLALHRGLNHFGLGYVVFWHDAGIMKWEYKQVGKPSRQRFDE
jgi:hypothetical protein